MILVDDIKYSCMECIRGHRSSLCRHHMRALLQVRSKGRPNVHANGNKNHRIAVFAEEIAQSPEPEGENCKELPVIILKASNKQVIDLTNGQILGPYEEAAGDHPPNPVIKSDSFVYTSTCCSKGATKTRHPCSCNKSKVSKSKILKSYIKKMQDNPVQPKKSCCGLKKEEVPLSGTVPLSGNAEISLDFSPFLKQPNHGVASNGEGTVFEVINVPSCSVPGSCCCSVECSCPNCMVHNNNIKAEGLEFLNNDAQFGSNLILTSGMRSQKPLHQPPVELAQPLHVQAGEPGMPQTPHTLPQLQTLAQLQALQQLQGVQLQGAQLQGLQLQGLQLQGAQLQGLQQLQGVQPAVQPLLQDHAFNREMDAYAGFLQQLIGNNVSEEPKQEPKQEPEESSACTCPDDACFCTNCEAHGIIEGYKLDDIFGSKVPYDFLFRSDVKAEPKDPNLQAR